MFVCTSFGLDGDNLQLPDDAAGPDAGRHMRRRRLHALHGFARGFS